MEISKATGLISGQMELGMMESGRIIGFKGEEKWIILKAISYKEFSKITILISKKISILTHFCLKKKWMISSRIKISFIK